jgi:hypothetical protein
MNVDDSRCRPMCLDGEGVGCKVVVGHGSDGRPCHGLRVKSTLESDKNFEQNHSSRNFLARRIKKRLNNIHRSKRFEKCLKSERFFVTESYTNGGTVAPSSLAPSSLRSLPR